MGNPLYVQTDGVRTFAGVHDEVAAAVSQLTGSAAPEALGVEISHGAIASAVSTALSNVLGSRQGTLQTTSGSGQKISELLQKAAKAYEEGDRQSAQNMVAAAQAMAEQGGTPGGPGSPAGTAGPAAGGTPGGESMGQTGQMLGQVGQQVGQIAQSIAAPLQGLA